MLCIPTVWAGFAPCHFPTFPFLSLLYFYLYFNLFSYNDLKISYTHYIIRKHIMNTHTNYNNKDYYLDELYLCNNFIEG